LCLVQDCSALQYFDFDTCSCLFVQQDCPRAGFPSDPANGFFDQVTGTCICLPSPITYPNGCTSITVDGNIVETYWSIVTCSCETLEDVCVNPHYYYDNKVGLCVCRPLVCASNEIFDVTECACKCKPDICPQGFYWSEHACACLCLEPAAGCGQDSTWDDKNCKCVCLEPATNPCPADFYWDNECCECFCAPLTGNVDIPRGKQWDTRTCSFICIQTECAAG
jgi:hypothetical protein